AATAATVGCASGAASGPPAPAASEAIVGAELVALAPRGLASTAEPAPSHTASPAPTRVNASLLVPARRDCRERPRVVDPSAFVAQAWRSKDRIAGDMRT